MFSTSRKNQLGKLIVILIRIETVLAVGILAIMGITSTMEIIARTFFATSFLWVNPLNLVLFSWLTFIGAAVIFYHKEYIIMDYFVDHFLSRIKRPLALAVDLGVMVFLVFILYEMPGLILGETYKMEILNIPTYILSLPMLIGIATILLLYIHRIHNFFGDGSATETQRHEEGEIVKGSG